MKMVRFVRNNGRQENLPEHVARNLQERGHGKLLSASAVAERTTKPARPMKKAKTGDSVGQAST